MSDTAAPQRSWLRANRQRVAPWVFLAPAILFFAVYVIVPIFQSMWISFYAWDGLGEKEWVGLANYAELFEDDRFYTSLKNNIIWLVLYLLAVPVGLCCSPCFSIKTSLACGFINPCSSFPLSSRRLSSA